jgi:hydroxyacylglutathione hydrolase
VAMIVEAVVVGALQVNCYVLGCEETRQAVVVDPGGNVRAIQGTLRKHGLTLAQIVATHAHYDHVVGARALQEATGAPFRLHPGDVSLLAGMRPMARAWEGIDPGEPPDATSDLLPGHELTFGAQVLEVRSTPGHSPGSVSLIDHAGHRAFTGDALFAGSIGRTDLPGGDMDTLLKSIRRELLSLPDDYQVLPGHGPGSTIGQERRRNPFLVEEADDRWA